MEDVTRTDFQMSLSLGKFVSLSVVNYYRILFRGPLQKVRTNSVLGELALSQLETGQDNFVF